MEMRSPRTLAQRATPLRTLATLTMVAFLAACTSLPPGAEHPKQHSTALSQPESTRLGKELAAQANRHPGLSGFHLLQHGPAGLMLRTQLIAAAERTIDIQYFIFAEDHTGKLLQQSILAAADRGVHVRMLVDDTNSFGERSSRDTLMALSDHRNMELRLFPFHYRGERTTIRTRRPGNARRSSSTRCCRSTSCSEHPLGRAHPSASRLMSRGST